MQLPNLLRFSIRYAWSVSIAIVIVVAGCFPFRLAVAQEDTVLRTVEQIHLAKTDELTIGLAVDLECIVLCYEPDWSILFVHDGRDGLYAGSPENLPFKRGDRIRIQGKIGPSRVPVDCIYELSKNAIEIPKPRTVDYDWLQSGHEDSQYVEIEGQLVGIDEDHSQITLEMRTQQGGRFRGLIHNAKVDGNKLYGMVGKRLRLVGVVGARFNEHQRWDGFQIWLGESLNIVEIENPGEPYQIPVTPISGLTAEAIEESRSSFFRTAGVVTYKLSPDMVLLQQGTHRLFVELNKSSPVALDRSYDIVGTLDTSVVPSILRMANATPSDREHTVIHENSFHSIDELVSGDHSGEIIQTVGTYSGPFELKGRHGFLLRFKDNLIPVFIDEGTTGEVASGTDVEVEGVWLQQKSLVGFSIGFSALHARRSGIHIGTQVPWLLMSVLGIAVAVTGLSSVWVISLRRQVRHETQQSHTLNLKLTEDLRARSIAEEKLRTTTGYLDVYRRIVDQHAIVAETDTAGTIVSVNDAFCTISGFSREELVGQNHRILNSGLHPKSMWIDMYKSVANGGFWHGEICNRKKDGRLYWVDTTIAPLFNDDGKIRGYFAIRADITSLKEAQVQAESANRSKSEFLANMSHEIRTPMTAILGYADILAEERENGFSSDTMIECIDTIKRNGEHLLSIINDILDISKIEADKMTAEKIRVSPIRLVQEVVELMRVKSNSKGLSLTTRCTEVVPDFILTDPTRLRQILVNLVGNAIKFTEIGGVTIAIRTDETNDNQIYFDVIDTGIGLREDQVSKLFQSFEQADTSMARKFGGTGLGLRISKRLAEILGGDITAVCSVGGGCVFTARVATGRVEAHDTTGRNVGSHLSAAPSSQGLEAQNDIQSDPQKLPSLDGVRILVVEDGPDNQRLIAFLLRKAGAKIEIVENGKYAVERLSGDSPLRDTNNIEGDFDLVLMDMQMPEMDGYQATQILRSKGCRIPILALTANAMDIDETKCLAAGCDFRLTKPIDKFKLIEACAHWAKAETSQF